MFDFTGRVALVSGGSKGLGSEMALALASHGASVALCSRHAEEAQSTAQKIAGQSGQHVLGYSCDVTRRDEIETLVAEVLAEFGRIDILINNAGSVLRKPILQLSDEEWSQALRLNLDSPFMMTREVVPHMIEAGYGRIINIASALGTIALPERAAYCSTKGGLIQLTKVMALEWARHGVTANALCPGPFRTAGNLSLEQNPAVYETYLNMIPQHRWGEPGEIGAAVVFLASQEASFVTGTSLFVDGGWTAHAGLPDGSASNFEKAS